MARTATEKVYTESEVEEMVEHAQGSSYMLGIVSGWDEASTYLRNEAASFFRIGKDREATMLRDLSDELRTQAKQRRAAYDEREAEHAKASEKQPGGQG